MFSFAGNRMFALVLHTSVFSRWNMQMQDVITWTQFVPATVCKAQTYVVAVVVPIACKRGEEAGMHDSHLVCNVQHELKLAYAHPPMVHLTEDGASTHAGGSAPTHRPSVHTLPVHSM